LPFLLPLLNNPERENADEADDLGSGTLRSMNGSKQRLV
jgi:hypothetical protein